MATKFIVTATTALIVLVVQLAEAQQPGKIPRVAWLSGSSISSTSANTEAFREGLRNLGYTEGKNIVIEWRGADGNRDRQRALAAELARLKVDIIVASSGGDTRAASGPMPIQSHSKTRRPVGRS